MAVVTGLQQKVIGMAFWCKKGGRQKGLSQLTTAKTTQQCNGTSGITVLSMIGLWCRIRTGAAILSEPITRPFSNGKNGWSSNQFLS